MWYKGVSWYHVDNNVCNHDNDNNLNDNGNANYDNDGNTSNEW